MNVSINLPETQIHLAVEAILLIEHGLAKAGLAGDSDAHAILEALATIPSPETGQDEAIGVTITPSQLYLAAAALDRIDLPLVERRLLPPDQDARATWEALMNLRCAIAPK